MHEDTDPLHLIVLLYALIAMAEVTMIGIDDHHLGVTAAHLDTEALQDIGAGEAGREVLYSVAQFAIVADAIVAVLFVALHLLHLQGSLMHRGRDLSLALQHQDPPPQALPFPNGRLMFHDQGLFPGHHLGVHVGIRAWCHMVTVLLIQEKGRISLFMIRISCFMCWC